MAYFTKIEARTAAKNKEQLLKKASTSILESVTAAVTTQTFDVFLSHSIKDADLILGVKELLEKMKLTVYVDWDVDKKLDRSKVNKETAELLRVRMKQSKSLIYVATEKASSSKWMPWELGYFDGHKPNKVAVLPLLDSANASFPEQEYLSLYPEVIKGTYKNSTKEVIYVSGAQWITLEDFPKSGGVWKDYSK